jgi:hypothetical protein
MSYSRDDIIDLIEQNTDKLGLKKVTVGFDGYIDEIVRPVKMRKKDDVAFYKNIEDFAQRLLISKNSACEMEIILQAVKIGGNAPIMAHALSSLGIYTNAVGAFGYPKINSYFEKHPDNLCLYSVAEPAYTTAFEFEDGKVMFGRNENLRDINWGNIENILGKEKIGQLIDESFIIAVTNWSSLYGMNDILKGLKLKMDAISINKVRISEYIFFDMADSSRRDREEIIEGLNLMKRFDENAHIIFSLNENEARIINRCFFEESEDIYATAQNIFKILRLHLLIIHPNNRAILLDGRRTIEVGDFFVKKPIISTGGGDNFNAGFCSGLAMQLPPEICLYLGRACASYYIKNSSSPSIDQLIKYMKDFWEGKYSE